MDKRLLDEHRAVSRFLKSPSGSAAAVDALAHLILVHDVADSAFDDPTDGTAIPAAQYDPVTDGFAYPVPETDAEVVEFPRSSEAEDTVMRRAFGLPS
jgi:hypothetical protein